ncbi:uncharacterized protein LOC108719859 [Xenopus laevis]|nr:uncharacterized protein LOC108719859 [Xenopus laevis]OCT73941.1 hypothetical protein XELAEV_18032903mg [Xenopus laevis]
MGPRYYLFIIICGILMQTCNSAPVKKIRNLNLLHHHLTVKPNTRSLVPCKFLPVLPIDATKMTLEWGKISKDSGQYTPLIILNSDGVKTFPETSRKYDLFVPLVSKGNCTLIISPTDATDSGVYEVLITLDGQLYESLSRTRITVSDRKQTSGKTRRSKSRANVIPTESTTANAMIDTAPTPVTNSTEFFALLLEKHGRATIIGVMVLLSILIIPALMALVVCCRFCCAEDPDEDEETPKENNQRAAQGEASVHYENETPAHVNVTSSEKKEENKSAPDESSSEEESQNTETPITSSETEESA